MKVIKGCMCMEEKLRNGLQEFMKDEERSYKFVASHCSIPKSTLYNFASGAHKTMKPDNLARLAFFLNCMGYFEEYEQYFDRR